MANVDLLVKVHNSTLEREFEIEGVVHQLFRDRSGEMGEGTTLSLPKDSLTHVDVAQDEAQLARHHCDPNRMGRAHHHDRRES